MAKKTQQHRSVPAKNGVLAKNGASTKTDGSAKNSGSAKNGASTKTDGSAKNSGSAKSNGARTPPTAAAGVKRDAEAVATTEPAEEMAAADEAAERAAEAVRWPNLPRGAREVLGLYEQRASELCFPGVTFESLAAQADRIDQLSANVEKAKRELAEAQAAQGVAESEFVEATKRAFAYAQVFAQEHAELRTELETFAYASADKPRRKKREDQETKPRSKQAANGAADEAATADEAEG